jgi:glycosyltransferase involved in cell wall biosynthesis
VAAAAEHADAVGTRRRRRSIASRPRASTKVPARDPTLVRRLPAARRALQLTVSVVIPSFNGARYLRAALDSALAQDPPPLEVIVQDGGSTDGTHELVAALGDPRVTLVSQPDSGQSQAINRAVSRARGEWICWLNVDDLLRPGLFAAARDAAADIDLVYGDFEWLDEQERRLRHFVPPDELTRERLLADGCYVFSGAMVMRRSVFHRFGGLDERLHLTMDYDFFLRIAPQARALHAPRTLGAFRVHGDSKTSAITWGVFVETGRVRRRHGGYRPATRTAVLVNQAKQLVDLGTLPLRRRLRG